MTIITVGILIESLGIFLYITLPLSAFCQPPEPLTQPWFISDNYLFITRHLICMHSPHKKTLFFFGSSKYISEWEWKFLYVDNSILFYMRLNFSTLCLFVYRRAKDSKPAAGAYVYKRNNKGVYNIKAGRN